MTEVTIVHSTAEFQTRDDMEAAVSKLDDKEFRGSYIRVTAEGAGNKRERSHSPRRKDVDDARSRSPVRTATDSPRATRSPSPAVNPTSPTKNSD